VRGNTVGQVVLTVKKPWRDRTKHLEKSLLEFMQLPIERPVCGDQIHWLYVSSGSGAGLQSFQWTDRFRSSS
jgi:hypothetical protein